MGKSSPGRFFPAACSRGTAERSTALPGTGLSEGFLHRPRPEERPSFKKRRSKNGTGSPRARGEHAPGLIFPLPERVYLPSVQGFRITAALGDTFATAGDALQPVATGAVGFKRGGGNVQARVATEGAKEDAGRLLDIGEFDRCLRQV